ncbi:MAG TPA: hypothetical protein VKM55_30520 [Candidatus Lokiarchaeia archaeon]|nr:hypothetical protein [Candidatus Lokiarchaeia archaeon]
MNDELFVFRSTAGNPEKKRAFIGNGYFGADISSNFGQGFGTCENKAPFPTTYLGGVYTLAYGAYGDKAVPKALFNAMNAYCIIPAAQSLDQEPGYMEDFCQEMDMKKALVTTKGTWHGYAIETMAFASRQRPNLGIVKIHCSSAGQDHHEFLYLVRKDPRTRYETFTFLDEGKLAMFDGSIIEDKKQFDDRGLYRIIQATTMQIIADDGTELPFETTWESKDSEDINFDGEATFTEHISIDTGTSFSIILYFGIYKETDTGGDLLDHARDSIGQAMQYGFEMLFEEHCRAWQDEIWSRVIEVPGDELLQRRIIAAMYAIGCSLKQGINNSAGPNGLNGDGWVGHVFWDADLWVNLGTLMWAPELSRCLTEFRHGLVDGARKNRESYVQEYGISGVTSGIKFAWESTTSGLERAPKGWGAQEHVTCDVIFGQYLYVTATGDEDYLRTIAFPLVQEACEYLAQRVVKGDDGKYHFLEVVPADEFVFPNHCDDDAFTNLYTGICIGIGMAWCDRFGIAYPPEWQDIRDNMFYNFDDDQQLVIEYTGYHGQTIKQADVDLLTFPLEYPLPDDVKRNNMLYYFDKLPKEHIMMSSSIFSTIACELGIGDKAWEYFSDLFAHFHEDLFFIASESPANECWPFITGLGGFLANLVYGFGGIRLRDDGLLICPFLPANIPEIVFNAIKFRGITMCFRVFDQGTKFSLHANADCSMMLHFRQGKEFSCLTGELGEARVAPARKESCYEVFLPENKEMIFELNE